MDKKKIIVIAIAAILIVGIGWFVYSKVSKPSGDTPGGSNVSEDPKQSGSYKKWGNDYVRETEA